MLNIAPFSPVFWGLFLVLILGSLSLSKLLKKKDPKDRREGLFLFYALVLLLYVFYKMAILFFDPAYSEICRQGGLGATSLWKELPLNPCNICLLLILYSLKKDNKVILSMCYYVSLFGAFFALVAPATGFSGYYLFTPRIFCFYTIHFLILLMPFLLQSLEIYQPEYRDIPKATALFVGLMFLAHVFNFIMRVTGLEVHSNYFYTYEPLSLLNILYNIIPVPFLYELPAIPILLVYMALVTTIARGISKLKKKVQD